MRYTALYQTDLDAFKRFDRDPGTLGIVALGASLVPQAISYGFGIEYTWVTFAAAAVLLLLLTATGVMRFRSPEHRLVIEDGTLRLEPDRAEAISLALDRLHPVAEYGSYRPLGVLPRVHYVRLLLEGGPLGPRELYFRHESEYAAKTWGRLGISAVSTLAHDIAS